MKLEKIVKVLALVESWGGLQDARPSVKHRLAETYLGLEAHVQAVEAAAETWASNTKTDRKITRERLLEKLDFDPATGNFTWKTTARAGKVAGMVTKERGKSYRRIRVDDELIMAHVLVWLVVYGELPNHEIDHENGIGTDNRPCNLVKSNRLKNNSNTATRKDSAEHRAVHLNGSKWATVVKYAKKHFHVSGFESSEKAAIARDFLEQLIPRGLNHGGDRHDRH